MSELKLSLEWSDNLWRMVAHFDASCDSSVSLVSFSLSSSGCVKCASTSGTADSTTAVIESDVCSKLEPSVSDNLSQFCVCPSCVLWFFTEEAKVGIVKTLCFLCSMFHFLNSNVNKLQEIFYLNL